MRLFDRLEHHSQSVALLDESGRTTNYGELIERGDYVGSAAAQRSLVLVACSNTVEAVTGYVGLVRAGHVCILVSSSISRERLNDLVNRFQPNYIYARHSTLADTHREVVARNGDHVLTRLTAVEAPMFSELALLLSTSGSTGSPLMVRQSHANILSNADGIVKSLGLGVSDRAITTLPMHYTYGLSIIHSQLHAGGSLVMSETSMTHRDFWSVINTTKPSYFGGVPYSYQILNRIGVERFRGKGLRMLTQAGGRLDPELALKLHGELKELNIDFHIMYGQTEATARMSILHSKELPLRPDSIGKPISGGMFQILDLDSGAPLAAGEVGELQYFGPNVALGYAESRNELDRGDDWHGVLRTGDLARCDADGYFYVAGRLKRYVKLFGNRISLDHVESHLNSLGIIAACGSSDDKLKVYVEGMVDSAKVLREVSTFVGVHVSGIGIHQIDRLPRSESGKIEYSNLEKLAAL